MNNNAKSIIAGILVLAGGMAFYISGKFVTPEGNSQYGAILNTQKVAGYAREVCLKALRDKLPAKLYSPTEIMGGDKDYVTLTWRPTMDSPHTVECRYEQVRGITGLTVDGKALAIDSVDISGDPNNRGGGSRAESHWGH